MREHDPDSPAPHGDSSPDAAALRGERERLAEVVRRELETHGDLYLPPGEAAPSSGEDASTPTHSSPPIEPSTDPKRPVAAVEPDAGADVLETRPKDSESVRMRLEELRTRCETDDSLRTDLPGTRLVFATGDPMADLLLVGEAPGEQEDLEGVPFVGRAGKLLDDILNAIGSHRDRVYIANILKHRPPGNRNPTPEERARSLPVLLRQIEIVQPRLILCLGRISGATLLGREASLADMRGEFHPFMGAELMVTYHPAALLRNPNWKRPTWEDMQRLRDRYRELACRPALEA